MANFASEKGNNDLNLKSGQPRPAEMTAFGELVYLRNGNKDFISKQKLFFHEQRDEVLAENLLDVRNLLKNATSSQAAFGKQPGQKALVNLQGIEPYYQKKDKFDKTLIFESRFESGNLAASLRVNEQDYYLALQNDVNTSGNTQWFFFRVSNTTAYNTVRFSILNLCKPDSLYNEGMKVLVYSEKHAAEKDIGWHRGGTKIAYYANGIRKDGTKSFRSLYTMTFSYEFEYEDDNVYFAYCYPYTYTELMEELNAIMADPIKQQYVSKKTLTETLAGNKCEMLTITSKQNPENMSKRKGVILTARVHPGESVGSWMMKGALDFLVDPDSTEAEYLRQNFVFKIVPMLNPDGVINGNYRCSLAGCDLNRRWKRPSKVLHPTIFATKQLCHQFSKERDLQIFCDFHGHSRRKNIFMYGCNVPGQPEDTRLYPFIMSNICPFFVYGHSRFGNQKSKESTARMALFNELKCPAIYTIESSFCGNDMGPYKNYHFSTNNLMQTGRDFCRTLMLYLPIQVPKSIVQTFQQNISDLYNHYKIISESKIKPDPEVESMMYYFERLEKVRQAGKELQSKHIKKGLAAVLRQTADIFSDGHTSSSAGSDNAPSEDNLDLEEIEKVLPVQEDPDLAIKVKKSKTNKMLEEKKDEQGQLKDKSSDAQALKRRNTTNENAGKKRSKDGLSRSGAANMNASGTKKAEKAKAKMNLNQVQEAKIKELEENDADDEGEKGSMSKRQKESDKEDDKEEGKETLNKDGNVIHKKRRRKNVECKDAQTQTERSDYMLIKQRQQQKQLMALLAQKNAQEGGDTTNQESDANKNTIQTGNPQSAQENSRQIIDLPSLSNTTNMEHQRQSHNVSQQIYPRANDTKVTTSLSPSQMELGDIGGNTKVFQGDNLDAGSTRMILQNNNEKMQAEEDQQARDAAGSAAAQKLLEDYLNQQKQGLVDNILSQYNSQQQQYNFNITPKKDDNQVTFSNIVLQTKSKFPMTAQKQHPDRDSQHLLNNNSPLNFTKKSAQLQRHQSSIGGAVSQQMTTGGQSYSSPSKKHRNLIQSRAGAAAYQLSNCSQSHVVNNTQQLASQGAAAAGTSNLQMSVSVSGMSQIQGQQPPPSSTSHNNFFRGASENHSIANNNNPVVPSLSQQQQLNQQRGGVNTAYGGYRSSLKGRKGNTTNSLLLSQYQQQQAQWKGSDPQFQLKTKAPQESNQIFQEAQSAQNKQSSMLMAPNTSHGPRGSHGGGLISQSNTNIQMASYHKQSTHQAPSVQGQSMAKEKSSKYPKQMAYQQQQSHWQKVTSNNHELSKLFSQLPGGTKTLVQNAIQSQQQQQQQQQQQIQQQQQQIQQQQQMLMGQSNHHQNSVYSNNSGFGQPSTQTTQRPQTKNIKSKKPFYSDFKKMTVTGAATTPDITTSQSMKLGEQTKPHKVSLQQRTEQKQRSNLFTMQSGAELPDIQYLQQMNAENQKVAEAQYFVAGRNKPSIGTHLIKSKTPNQHASRSVKKKSTMQYNQLGVAGSFQGREGSLSSKNNNNAPSNQRVVMVGSWIPPEDSGEVVGGTFNASMAFHPNERMLSTGDNKSAQPMNTDMHQLLPPQGLLTQVGNDKQKFSVSHTAKKPPAKSRMISTKDPLSKSAARTSVLHKVQPPQSATLHRNPQIQNNLQLTSASGQGSWQKKQGH